MGRIELTLIIGSALVVAVIIGWGLRWFFDKMNTSGPMASDVVVSRMRTAEAAQAEAEKTLEDVKQTARGAERRLEAELEAAMTGLGNARREAESWREEAEAWRTEVDDLRGHSNPQQ